LAAGGRPQRLMPLQPRRHLRRLPALTLVAVLLPLLLVACAPRQTAGLPPTGIAVPPAPGAAFTPVSFSQLPGWSADRAGEAIPAFLAGCVQLTGAAPLLQARCAEARTLPPGDDAAARAFFERGFQPHLASQDGSTKGLVTGYFEPEFRASRTRQGEYQTPLLRLPRGHAQGAPLPTRAQINRGALARQRLEMLWLADPIDAFFLHIQGAGRARLPDGSTLRVGYAGRNNQPYVPIGRILVDRGEMKLEDVSMQRIRAWLEAHPAEAEAVMDQNPNYIFFREIQGIRPDEGPPGAMGASLTPLRSVAVDRDHMPLGTPVWLDTLDALQPDQPLRRLVMAQDVGGAIRGPTRADVFFGWGAQAEQHAGRMRQPGTVYVLLPR